MVQNTVSVPPGTSKYLSMNESSHFEMMGDGQAGDGRRWGKTDGKHILKTNQSTLIIVQTDRPSYG